MAENDLQFIVESLDAASAENIEKTVGNFTLDIIKRASALIGYQLRSRVFVNRTLQNQCMQQAETQKHQYPIQHLSHTVLDHFSSTESEVKTSMYCPTTFDSVLCWPRTSANSWAILPCFEEFKGVYYDTTENATRYCHKNGTWNNYSNYSRCLQHSGTVPVVPDFSASVDLPAIIYACGYFISFATLVVALIIFISFKDLRCLRNTIHANLFLTYITSALLWILTLLLQEITIASSQPGCITLVIMFQYFYLTNFFWIFVEGLYLYTLVVQTFSSENISIVIYGLIGWGCPAFCILIWSVAKAFASHLENDHFNGLQIECTWMRESHVDWIFKGPASMAILINLVFLVRIMWVLIKKLRSVHTLETRQYYKASKALLVLIPLFGITYLLVLTGPEQGISRNLFEAIRAILLSTQGFFVALFYCFLNSEVRQTLRHHFIRWQESRNVLRTKSQNNRRLRTPKDYSQRSRTESIRLTSSIPVPIVHFE